MIINCPQSDTIIRSSRKVIWHWIDDLGSLVMKIFWKCPHDCIMSHFGHIDPSFMICTHFNLHLTTMFQVRYCNSFRMWGRGGSSPSMCETMCWLSSWLIYKTLDTQDDKQDLEPTSLPQTCLHDDSSQCCIILQFLRKFPESTTFFSPHFPLRSLFLGDSIPKVSIWIT